MKLIIKVILLAVVLFFIVNFVKSEVDSKEEDSLVSFKSESGKFEIKIREKERNQIKSLTDKVKGLIYKEATLHNPQGDVLPDQIDDQIKQKVKETIN